MNKAQRYRLLSMLHIHSRNDGLKPNEASTYVDSHSHHDRILGLHAPEVVLTNYNDRKLRKTTVVNISFWIKRHTHTHAEENNKIQNHFRVVKHLACVSTSEKWCDRFGKISNAMAQNGNGGGGGIIRQLKHIYASNMSNKIWTLF